MSNKPLNLKQASELLGVHENTLYRYLKDGKIKGYQIGKKKLWRIYELDLDKFIRGEE